ncbi:MAG: HAD family hydrolase [Candidatus Nanopelagicaceae bacterium]
MKDFYSAVFFDMDGLFVDSEPLWLIAETELMASYGYTWNTEDQNYCLGGPLKKVGQYMFEKSGNVESPDFFTQSIIDLMEKKLSLGAPVMPGAMELLEELAFNKVQTALVSASPRVLVDAVLRRFPENKFSFSLSADDVSNPKPNPEAYLKAAEKFSVEIENCLILEDSPTGVQAATASGAFTIAVPHFVDIQPRDKLQIISSLRELNYEILKTNYALDI